MAKAVVLFSGQGAQKVGMGKDLVEAFPVAKALFDKADEILDIPLSKVMFEGPTEELTRTSYCQPALYLHGLAMLEIIKEKLPNLEITATAGLSLGEFTAHAAASTFSFEEGLKIVAKRGALMEEACEATQGAMAAMIGGAEDDVKKLAEDCNIDVANFNAPGQIIVSGTVEGVEKAVAEAKGRGIKLAKKLNVAGAYHSRLMQQAQDAFGPVLEAASIATPTMPVICNYGAKTVKEASDIREMCTNQVTGSVRWTESINLLLDQGEDLFLELGPGKVLTGLMGRIKKGTPIHAIEDITSLEKALETLA